MVSPGIDSSRTRAAEGIVSSCCPVMVSSNSMQDDSDDLATCCSQEWTHVDQGASAQVETVGCRDCTEHPLGIGITSRTPHECDTKSTEPPLSQSQFQSMERDQYVRHVYGVGSEDISVRICDDSPFGRYASEYYHMQHQ